MVTTFVAAALNIVCSTTVPVGTPLHWSMDVLPAWMDVPEWLVNKNELDKDCSLQTREHLRLVVRLQVEQ